MSLFQRIDTHLRLKARCRKVSQRLQLGTRWQKIADRLQLKARWHRVTNRPCRGCNEIVGVWEDICPHCGAYGPCRIPYSALVIIGLFCLVVLWRCSV